MSVPQGVMVTPTPDTGTAYTYSRYAASSADRKGRGTFFVAGRRRAALPGIETDRMCSRAATSGNRAIVYGSSNRQANPRGRLIRSTSQADERTRRAVFIFVVFVLTIVFERHFELTLE